MRNDENRSVSPLNQGSLSLLLSQKGSPEKRSFTIEWEWKVSQQEGMAEALEAGRNQRFPLAKRDTYGPHGLATRNASSCSSEIRGMAELQDGPEINSTGPGASDWMCGKLNSWYKYGTTQA
jgi:hypothetical protein